MILGLLFNNTKFTLAVLNSSEPELMLSSAFLNNFKCGNFHFLFFWKLKMLTAKVT
jgi:hypothetical protein